jgi:hypothetical protein
VKLNKEDRHATRVRAFLLLVVGKE